MAKAARAVEDTTTVRIEKKVFNALSPRAESNKRSVAKEIETVLSDVAEDPRSQALAEKVKEFAQAANGPYGDWAKSKQGRALIVLMLNELLGNPVRISDEGVAKEVDLARALIAVLAKDFKDELGNEVE